VSCPSALLANADKSNYFPSLLCLCLYVTADSHVLRRSPCLAFLLSAEEPLDGFWWRFAVRALWLEAIANFLQILWELSWTRPFTELLLHSLLSAVRGARLHLAPTAAVLMTGLPFSCARGLRFRKLRLVELMVPHDRSDIGKVRFYDSWTQKLPTRSNKLCLFI
jgi:hypothetical protein